MFPFCSIICKQDNDYPIQISSLVLDAIYNRISFDIIKGRQHLDHYWITVRVVPNDLYVISRSLTRDVTITSERFIATIE